METEFWGVEVKNGEPLKVSPGNGMVLHLSQASLGEHKNEKGKECVSLFVNVDGKKLVLGTLITNKLPQHQFDLLFDRDFELSHDWKSGSVYFYGYKASNSFEEDELPEGESGESESEEDIPFNLANNVAGKPESKANKEKPESKDNQEKPESKANKEKPESNANQEKPESEAKQEKPEYSAKQEKHESKAKQEKPADAERASAPKEEPDAGRDPVKTVETHKDVNPQQDEESSYEDLMSEDDDEDDSQDSMDSNDKSDEKDKETLKKVKKRKKRPVESAAKTPDPDKRAKVTPQKPDGNETAPLPGKEMGKTPANKPNKQTPKSGGSYPCKMCNRRFGTEQGVEAHTKAKHGDGK